MNTEPDLSCLLCRSLPSPGSSVQPSETELTMHVSVLRLSSSVSQGLVPNLSESVSL